MTFAFSAWCVGLALGLLWVGRKLDVWGRIGALMIGGTLLVAAAVMVQQAVTR